MDEYFANIDFHEKEFLSCIFLTWISSILYTILPHIQFKWKVLTKIFLNNSRAVDAFAFIMIQIASYRFYAFIECIFVQKKISLSNNLYILLLFIGITLVISGFILIILGFRLLGLRGMYFGDHFGFKLKGKLHSFPYDVFSNPQYTGMKFIYFGIAICFASPSGLFLAFNIMLAKEIVFEVEKRKLKILYPE
jgi:phosphatidylethanolamine/phosphatidyl-N-methylethanolamine N-methyltransferase